MWYLILLFTGFSGSNSPMSVVIPEPYYSIEECQKAGVNADRFKCIPAPKKYDKSIDLNVPGYYCGNFPNKCKIENLYPVCNDKTCSNLK